jgi:tRNA wybutosine-synthesizing protein 2
MMKPFKQFLQEALKGKMPAAKLSLLPSGFQKIGDIILVSLDPRLEPHSNKIGDAVLKGMKAKTVCSKAGAITGELRKPSIKTIAGNGTETVHTENGCKYMLDVTKVMFAKGNVRERARLAKIVGPKEDIIDMFAGIGYFSIPIAKACPGCRITAMDVNPDSIHYLKENCRLNKVSNIEAVNEDCRKAALEHRDSADRVLMGYLPGTSGYLRSAFEMLKPRGVIHFHDVFGEDMLWENVLDMLGKTAKLAGYRMVEVAHNAKVKQYAPGKWHVVVDAVFEKGV